MYYVWVDVLCVCVLVCSVLTDVLCLGWCIMCWSMYCVWVGVLCVGLSIMCG